MIRPNVCLWGGHDGIESDLAIVVEMKMFAKNWYSVSSIKYNFLSKNERGGENLGENFVRITSFFRLLLLNAAVLFKL